jgi:hypothetical protein
MIHSTSVPATKTPFSVLSNESSNHDSDHGFQLTLSQVTGAGEHFTKCALTASEILEIQSEQHWVVKI